LESLLNYSLFKDYFLKIAAYSGIYHKTLSSISKFPHCPTIKYNNALHLKDEGTFDATS